MLNKKIQIAPSAPVDSASVNFDRNDFNQAIDNKGFVYIERAIECPCRSEEAGNNPLISCRNCGGSGWVFLNKIQTKAIVHSMNLSNQYKEWSSENIGTVSITVKDTDRLSYMDKISIRDAEVEFSQTVFPKRYQDKIFAFTVYEIKRITDLYLFISPDVPLKRLFEGVDYSFENNKIFLSEKYQYNNTLQLSVRYLHAPTFHIIDMIRESMVAKSPTDEGEKEVQFPLNYIGRRVHNVDIMMKENLNGNRIFDNSYYQDKCK